MCGRYVVARASSDLVGLFDIDEPGENLPDPSWNVAPTDPIPVVIESAKTGQVVRRLESARWGLVPSWAKDPKVGAKMFNARIESVQEKASFKQAIIKRRALIPATGYYEWHKSRTPRQPYFIHPTDESPLVFAGLYEWWRDPSKDNDDPDRWLLSATVITRDSLGALAGLHDRMPLALTPAMQAEWLNPHNLDAAALVGAALDDSSRIPDLITAYPVGTAVGSVRNNGPELITPISDQSDPSLLEF